ncbi:MAG: hypothetical protein AAGH74_07080 [Pseudomonadota bacterium]
MKQGPSSHAIFWSVILFGLAASVIANVFLMIIVVGQIQFPYVPRYLLFQYLFSYQDLGFVRRGLIGSLFDLPNDAGRVWQVYVFATGQFAALLIAMAYWLNRHGDPGFAWIVVLSPATFLQVGFDFGRLDALFVLLTALNLMSRKPWPILVLPLMVLIHEGSIVMFAPLIVLGHVYRFGITPMLVASAALAVGFVVWFALDTQLLEVPIYEVYPALPPVTDILRLSFAENWKMAIGHYAETWSLMIDVPFFLLVHLVAGFYIFFLFAYVRGQMPPGLWRLLLSVACLTPLLLSPVGIDLGRWAAMSVFNLILLNLAWARWEPPEKQPMTVLSGGRFAMLCLLFSFGPFAFARPFPFLRNAFYNLHNLVN